MRNNLFRPGVIVDHTWKTVRSNRYKENKSMTRRPYYLVKFDDSAKVETIASHMLYPIDQEMPERIF